MTSLGDTYKTPSPLAAEWWQCCSDNGLTVTIYPPLSEAVPIEFDGFCYRRGVVSRGQQQVLVAPSPGQRPQTGGDFVGCSLIILSSPSSQPTQNNELLDLVGQLLIKQGASLICSNRQTK